MSIRITSQMLDRAASKAGLPINSTSLLDYINKDSSGNSLLDSLQNNQTQSQNQKLYEKLKDTADALEDAAGALSDGKKGNIFEQAKKSGDNSEVLKSITRLIERYNELKKQLEKDADSPISAYYGKTIKELASKNSEALGALGITVGKDGGMVLDEKKLNAAKTEELEKMFGSDSEFIQKLQYLSSHVSDNASAEIKSVGNLYGQDANTFSSYVGNKFDWRS